MEARPPPGVTLLSGSLPTVVGIVSTRMHTDKSEWITGERPARNAHSACFHLCASAFIDAGEGDAGRGGWCGGEPDRKWIAVQSIFGMRSFTDRLRGLTAAPQCNDAKRIRADWLHRAGVSLDARVRSWRVDPRSRRNVRTQDLREVGHSWAAQIELAPIAKAGSQDRVARRTTAAAAATEFLSSRQAMAALPFRWLAAPGTNVAADSIRRSLRTQSSPRCFAPL